MNTHNRIDYPVIIFVVCAVLSFMLPVGNGGLESKGWLDFLGPFTLTTFSVLVAIAYVAVKKNSMFFTLLVTTAVLLAGAGTLKMLTPDLKQGVGAIGIWLFVFGLGFYAWRAMELMSFHANDSKILKLIVPIFFGVWFIYLWELVTVGFEVPSVLLPSPSMIGLALVGNMDVLSADFFQTFVKSVLSGYAFGCGSGLVVAILVDKIPFLQRGLLPLGSLVSAIPIVGIAPIMVMWFGFDWQSKAAVIVIMTFFPMLVNTLAGLEATSRIEQDLMRSYAASYFQTLFFVRLPNALPFIFNALKINSTLALIGAIVAEFFGTPIVGMGFRISTEVGRMNVDIVWATIAVAAVAGSLSYGIIALIERSLTFWHPSYRSARS
jgi:NitT/TauT family transport system permease protein